jgi:hypothetical protein
MKSGDKNNEKFRKQLWKFVDKIDEKCCHENMQKIVTGFNE